MALLGDLGLQVHAAHGLLRENAGHDDQAQEERDEEIEEIVAGVDGGHAEPDDDEQAPPAVAGGPDGPARPEGPPPPFAVSPGPLRDPPHGTLGISAERVRPGRSIGGWPR